MEFLLELEKKGEILVLESRERSSMVK